MEKYNITFHKIGVRSRLTNKGLFLKFSEKSYSKDSGWGFSSLTLSDTAVHGILLKEAIRYYQVWNEESQVLEKRTYSLLQEINFSIDIEHGFCIVEGGMKNLNLLKQALRQTMYNEFTYSSLSMSPFQLLEFFVKEGKLHSIENIVLSDFKADAKFIGKYNARLINPNIDISELKHYSIDKFNATLSNDYGTYNLIANANTTYIIIGTEEDRLDFVEFFTSKILSYNG